VRTLAAAVLLTAALLCAQAYRDLLLLQARSISGTVSDADGKPIGGARIEHSDNRRETIQTDATGRFNLRTRAPAVVIRKAGYRSQWLRITDISEVPITLQPGDSDLQIRACPRTEPCESIDGWGAQFCFPRVPGVTASRQGQDIDYGIRGYVIDNSKAGIRHGSGPLWGFGLPSDDDVWRSVEYRETVFGTDPLITIDARGRTADGKFWRNLGKFGESASYRDVNEADAQLLDRVLDGACIRANR
jgi:carboxypeptidase family protein